MRRACTCLFTGVGGRQRSCSVGACIGAIPAPLEIPANALCPPPPCCSHRHPRPVMPSTDRGGQRGAPVRRVARRAHGRLRVEPPAAAAQLQHRAQARRPDLAARCAGGGGRQGQGWPFGPGATDDGPSLPRARRERWPAGSQAGRCPCQPWAHCTAPSPPCALASVLTCRALAGLEAAVAAENASPRGAANGGNMISLQASERSLLTCLLAKMQVRACACVAGVLEVCIHACVRARLACSNFHSSKCSSTRPNPQAHVSQC